MTVNKIKDLYMALKLNRTRFAKSIGYGHTTIIRIEDGTIRSLSSKLCKAIYNAFPQVNPVWLEEDKGPMFRPEEPVEVVREVSPHCYADPICRDICRACLALGPEEKKLALKMIQALTDFKGQGIKGRKLGGTAK